MMQGQEIDVGRMLVGGGYFVLSIGGVIIMSYYAVRSFRSDIDNVIVQTDKINSKVDHILSTIARHDQRAADTQDRVVSIEGRVTYLERRE